MPVVKLLRASGLAVDLLTVPDVNRTFIRFTPGFTATSP